jgi:hypothetical protein
MFKDADLGGYSAESVDLLRQISTLFWINICLALLISMVMFLTAPLVADSTEK